VRIGAGVYKCDGTVQDMSSTGARVEGATFEPTEGARVDLELALFQDSEAIRLQAQVVRKTETGGFAVCFLAPDPRTQQLLRAALPKAGKARVLGETESRYSGQFVTQLGSELHRSCAEAAEAQGKTLEEWIRTSLGSASLAAADDVRRHREARHDPATCKDCQSKREQSSED